MAVRAAMAVRRAAVARAAGLERRGAHGYGWLHKHYLEEDRRLAREAEWARAPALPETTQEPRPKAFLEFSTRGEVLGRVTVELAADLLPKASDNFLKLCKGAEVPLFGGAPEPVGYKGSQVHQIWKDTFLVMGDYLNADGTGGHSALGDRFFEDEGYFVRHTKPGILSMAKGAVDQNSSVFFFTLKPLPHLDGRFVAFGHTVEGMDVLEEIGRQFIIKGRPVDTIEISDCGVL